MFMKNTTPYSHIMHCIHHYVDDMGNMGECELGKPYCNKCDRCEIRVSGTPLYEALEYGWNGFYLQGEDIQF